MRSIDLGVTKGGNETIGQEFLFYGLKIINHYYEPVYIRMVLGRKERRKCVKSSFFFEDFLVSSVIKIMGLEDKDYTF